MSSSIHPTNTSPIRKQLAKRMINYYDQLSNSKAHDRSRSHSKERSLSKSMSRSKSKSKEMDSSKMSGTKGSQVIDESEVYEDAEHRRLKLHKLKELMVAELQRGEGDGGLEPDYDHLQKLHKGYPTFMKDLETDEHMLEDHHHTNVKEFLNEKVGDFDHLPEEDSYDSAEEDFLPASPTRSQLLAESKLFHLVVEEPLERSNAVSDQAFNFHQRKAKEIRRLQYAAGVGRKTAPVKTPKSPKPLRLTYYAIWVLMDGQPVPARLGTDCSKSPDQKGTLVINEDDSVKVKTRKENKGRFEDFDGKIKKPTPEEPDCDFIAETEDGKRHPIWIVLRPPKKPEQKEVTPVVEEKPVEKVQAAPPRPARTRKLAKTNCTIYDVQGNKKLGRAVAELVGKDSVTGNQVVFSKGVLLDSNNSVSLVLFKRLSDTECIIKRSNNDQTLEEITESEPVEDFDSKLTRYVLKKNEDDLGEWPKELYLYEGPLCIEALKIFNDEFINAICENNIDYQGKSEWAGLTEDAADDDEGQLYIHHKDQLGRKDKVKIVMDQDNEDRLRMAKLWEYLLTIAKARIEVYRKETVVTKTKKAIELGELSFSIVDKKGRKIKILIKNDSDSEGLDSSDEQELDVPLESAYYHLMVEDQRVLPFARKEKKQKVQRDVETHKVQEVKVVREKYVAKSQISNSIRVARSETSADRAVFAKMASHQGLKFASEDQYDAFIRFMLTLPEGIDQKKAVSQYKEMMVNLGC